MWWAPFLLIVLLGWGLVYVAEQRIGLQKIVENGLQARPKAEAMYEKATPEQRAQQIKVTGVIYYVAIPTLTKQLFIG